MKLGNEGNEIREEKKEREREKKKEHTSPKAPIV